MLLKASGNVLVSFKGESDAFRLHLQKHTEAEMILIDLKSNDFRARGAEPWVYFYKTS